MEQYERNEMENQAGYLSRRVSEVLSALQLKVSSLPRKAVNPKAMNLAPRFGNAPLNREWSLALDFCEDKIFFELSLMGGPRFAINDRSRVLEALSHETSWRQLIKDINGAMEKIVYCFETVLQEAAKSLSPEAAELYYRILGMQIERQRDKETIQTLTDECKSLNTKKIQTQTIIIQSVPVLQKAAQDLHDTRTYLGQSKTIKGIRERIEVVIKELEVFANFK